jgi:hypothetical protein
MFVDKSRYNSYRNQEVPQPSLEGRRYLFQLTRRIRGQGANEPTGHTPGQAMAVVLPGSRDRQINIFANGSPDGRINPARPLATTTIVSTELADANPGTMRHRVTFYDFFGDESNPRVVATPQTIDIENAQDPNAVTYAVQLHMATALSSGSMLTGSPMPGVLPTDYREGEPVSEEAVQDLISLLQSPDATTTVA